MSSNLFKFNYYPEHKMRLEYAIVSANGLFYTGKVNSDTQPNLWLSPNKQDAFTYTEKGAMRKIQSVPFRNFSVVHMA